MSRDEPTTTLLPVVTKAGDHPCFECAKCCNYVAVEIDEPRSMKDYDHVFWYLYHGGVSVFVDWDAAWYIQFDTRCEHLTREGLCSIYERRPGICKDFDWRDCEQNVTDGPPDKFLFRTADDFKAWFEERRPKAWQRYQRFLRKKHATAQDPELDRLEADDPS